MELFIFVDRYNDGINQNYEYYLTDNAQKCYEIAEKIDKQWYKADENDEEFDYFMEFKKECDRNGITLEHFKDIVSFVY